MCLEMVLLQEITEARMDGKAFHRRKRLHTPSDLTSSAKYREVKRAAEDHKQWWRQRSKKARSFRGQKILQPGHPDERFS